MASPGEKKLFLAIEELLTNSPDTFLDASEILLRFANNILNNVDVDKYRQLRLSNPIIEAKLLSVAGAMECLFEMGFEEDAEYLRFPKTKSLDILTSFRDRLLAERGSKLKASPKKLAEPVLPSLPPPPVHNKTWETVGPQRNELASKMSLLVSEQGFFHKLQSNLLHVLIYEDSSLQKRALDLIPLQDMLTTSGQKALNAKATVQNGEKPLDMRDFLLLELLNWFKHSFFRWVDCPECSNCGKTASERRGMLEPTEEEKRYGANRVEGYYCTPCRNEERFPRFNHPGKLLETRRGRCGEWANCFTLCCRAVGFEARYVLDWTDHVWTEVYSYSQSRWIHCDPCENAYDKPLMYETGWGKKLTYILAFAKDDIKDVTWRYTRNFDLVLKRRRECREDWLVETVLKLRERKQSNLSELRRNELLHRALQEFAELLMPKDGKDEELQGRISGSLAWRQARGENGKTKKESSFLIRPSRTDLEKKSMTFSYNSATDRYQFSNGESSDGWEAIAHGNENVFRKEEKDWSMVYLAIAERAESGNLSWKIDLSDCDASIDKVTVQCASTKFEKGHVQWRLCGAATCVSVIPGQRLETSDFSGEKELTLKAVLTAGQGAHGWQHAQLFRLHVDDKTARPLDVTVTFK